MHVDLTKKIESSFISCEKDANLIFQKLFVDSKPHSKILKKLLLIGTKDCLSEISEHKALYDRKVEEYSIARMKQDGYITLMPRLKQGEHEELKSYIILSFSDFTPTNENPQFRDCSVYIDILCPFDIWELEDYQMRPLKIAGYIDGILNNTRLTGIGTFQFLQAEEKVFSEDYAGYTLMYRAVHGSDDRLPPRD